MANEYKCCTRCVIDTTDPNVVFDENGVCNYCLEYDDVHSKQWFRGEEGKKKMNELVNEIKAYGKGKEYDCIIGISGGVDSSYLAYLAHEQGLRMLAVHVDAGWNSELAVKNIQSLCTFLKLDLITVVIDWEIMQDLQRAFFKSRVVNQDIPQDHAFFAALYKYAVQNNIKYVLNGYNVSTESTLPDAWRGYRALDSTHLKAIHKKYGIKPLRKFPLIGFWRYRIYYNLIRGMKVHAPLNFVDYNKTEALKKLSAVMDWNDYGEKHHESRFTKFHQCYFLPNKFGFDKRRAHLASLIQSGQLTKVDAEAILKTPNYNNNELEEDKQYISKKLGLTLNEFDEIMNQPAGRHEDYPSEITLNMRYEKFVKKVKSILSRN
jgi:N-acetyl sugar amidotransferase